MTRSLLVAVLVVGTVLMPSAAARAAASGYVMGTVTSAVTGAGIANVSVYARDVGGVGSSATTDADGHYQLEFASLTATVKYKVCFYTLDAYVGPRDPGYLNECYRNVPWPKPPAPLPADATRVSVSPGETTSHISAVLDRAGGVSGRVMLSDGSGPVTHGYVTFFDAAGHPVYDNGSASIDSQGRFVQRRLPPGDYFACSSRTPTTAPGGVFGACYPNVRWSDDIVDAPAAGAQPVTVPAGPITTDIVIRAKAAGAISGIVTAAAGGAPVAHVDIEAYDADAVEVASTTTGADGTYLIAGLEPSAHGYTVCFRTQDLDEDDYPFGLVPQCADGVTWNPGQYPPAGARSVPALSGGLATGVDAALEVGGTIKGQVTDADTGKRVVNIRVVAFAPDGRYVEGIITLASGTYYLRGLAPSTVGYRVCFNATAAETATGMPLQLQSQCFDAQPWNVVDASPPPSARRVAVVAGVTRAGVNAVLEHGGGITGTVRVPKLPPAYGVLVEAFDESGQLVASTTSNGSTYHFNGLPPTSVGYRVCFDPRASTRPDLLPECYRNKPWDGDTAAVPAAATLVPVSVDVVAPSINATLDAP